MAVAMRPARWEGEPSRGTCLAGTCGSAAGASFASGAACGSGAMTDQGSGGQRMLSSISDSIAVNVMPCLQM